MTIQKIWAIIPTFNESASLPALLADLFALPLNLSVLVVDDASPDGTSEVVQALMPTYPRLRLLKRLDDRGRGHAGRDGFIEAMKSDADFFVEMDGDGSHQARFIPNLLEAMGGCDIAVGSRQIVGGRDRDRPWHRRCLTSLATRVARMRLGLSTRDVNSGFRCYTREALVRIEPAALRSEGPSIVQEVFWRAKRAGLCVREVPIEFVDRRSGSSKLNLARIWKTWIFLFRLQDSHV